MIADAKPYLGPIQPGLGPHTWPMLFWMAKTRKSKKDRPPSLLRGVVALNVRNLRDAVYASERSATARNTALAKAAGTVKAQIERILNQEVGVSIDLIERLATALRCRPQDLLTPYFQQSHGGGLETKSPPMLAGGGGAAD